MVSSRGGDWVSHLMVFSTLTKVEQASPLNCRKTRSRARDSALAMKPSAFESWQILVENPLMSHIHKFAVYQTFCLEPKQTTKCRISSWMCETLIPAKTLVISPVWFSFNQSPSCSKCPSWPRLSSFHSSCHGDVLCTTTWLSFLSFQSLICDLYPQKEVRVHSWTS